MASAGAPRTGALKIAVYEAYDLLFSAPFAAWGMSKFAKSMFCGACSGVTTGLLTTPIDVVMTRIMTEVHDARVGGGEGFLCLFASPPPVVFF